MNAALKPALRTAALASLALACSDGVFDPDDSRGWTVATVQGSVVSDYEGTGRFSISYDQGTSDIFEIRSTDVLRGGIEGIVLERFGSQLPATGRHWIGGYEDDFFARYERFRNGQWEWYAADFGTLDIWSATSERIEGEFRFSAALTCVGDGYAMECTVPPPPNAPRILVEGSFVAIRGSSYGMQ